MPTINYLELFSFLTSYDSFMDAYLNIQTGMVSSPEVDEELEDALEDKEEVQNWLKIEPLDPSVNYQIMKNFIQEKVTNADIKLLLSEAIKGKGAFRRFNNHLCDYPETQQDWHAYREQESQKIVVKWLNENEINDFGLVDS